jgi:ElaB/YqjD/DUF883 family membrane-anchored ribosome-binding protein
MPATEGTREKLVSDLRAVISGAEELIKATADQTSETIASLRERTRQRLEEARRSLEQEERVLLVKAKQRARKAEAYVRENPWNVLGIVAGMGIILLALLLRRE